MSEPRISPATAHFFTQATLVAAGAILASVIYSSLNAQDATVAIVAPIAVLAAVVGAASSQLAVASGMTFLAAPAPVSADNSEKEDAEDGNEGDDTSKDKDAADEEKKKAKTEAKEKKKKAQREAEKAQRWRKQEQVWSEEQYTWIDKEDKEDEDDDEDNADAGLLFVARHRVDPKVDTDGQGTTVVYLRSEALMSVLRRRMKSVEDLYDTEASCEGKDIFLHRAKLADEKERMVARIAELKAREPALETETETDSKPVEAAEAAEAVEKSESAPAESAPAKDGQAPVEGSTAEQTETAATEESKDATADLVDDDEVEGGEYAHISRADLEKQLDHLEVLLNYIKTDFAKIQAKLERLSGDEQISFKLLWCIYVPGEVIETIEPGTDEKMAFKLRRATYGSDQQGPHYMLHGYIIEWTGERYTKVFFAKKIPAFKGLRKIRSLPAYPIEPKKRAELTERGRRYTKYAGVHYVRYTGPLVKYVSGQMVKSRADGRVICDIKGYRKMEPSNDCWGNEDYDDDEDDGEARDDDGATSMETLEESQLCLTPPNVYGFSLSLKEWGELSFSHFEDITFEEGAYRHLVLDDDYKMMIQSLVKSACTPDLSQKLLSDVIQNKAGGLIILLHGTPGTGKTLTAEAVAEQLKRPLYSIGAGELGLEARTLERNLRDTLEVTNQWKAVVLIDEADVFLEQRSDHEIQRNALVSVFLRLLEYHSGVLFLTTNRIKSFDAAFLSRFSIALRYPDLDTDQRIMVWIKFLKLVGAEVEEKGKRKITNGVIATATPAEGSTSTGGGVGTDGPAPTPPPTPPPRGPVFSMATVRKYASRPINGRVIKQTIRTAQALALAADEPLKEAHIETVLKIQERFTKDFEKSIYTDDLYKAKDAAWSGNEMVYQ